VIDWSDGAKFPFYSTAAANTKYIGFGLARVMQMLADASMILLERSTILGFSLGAHVAGFAGRELKNLRQIIGKEQKFIFFP